MFSAHLHLAFLTLQPLHLAWEVFRILLGVRVLEREVLYLDGLALTNCRISLAVHRGLIGLQLSKIKEAINIHRVKP